MESHIQENLRIAASRARDVVRIGPFLATFSRQSTNSFLNYAIPDPGIIPAPPEVAALIATYRHRNRVPRLEYLTHLAPAVEPVLLAAGFVVEQRLQVMVCLPDALREVPVPPGIELIVPTSDDALLALATVQSEAYGDPAPDYWDVAARRDHLASGGSAILARDAATAEPAGAGVRDAPLDNVAELAGVGVRPAFRRRGIAGAVTARLTHDAFAAGVAAVFLMAAHAEEQRIYSRVGFSAVSEVLHISLADS